MVEGLSQPPWSLHLNICLRRDSAPTCLATAREGAPAGLHLSGLSLAPQLESPLAISGRALGWRVWEGGQGPLAWLRGLRGLSAVGGRRWRCKG